MFFCFTLLCTHSLHVETVDHRRVFQLYPCECQSIFSSISVAYCSSDITILALVRNRLECPSLCFFHFIKRKYWMTEMTSWMQIAGNIKKYTHKTWHGLFSHTLCEILGISKRCKVKSLVLHPLRVQMCFVFEVLFLISSCPNRRPNRCRQFVLFLAP